MSLDLYVMPMWRFELRDCLTFLELHHASTYSVEMVGGSPRRKRPPSRFETKRAKADVAGLQRWISDALKQRVSWVDEGEVVHQMQLPPPLALLAFARWRISRDTGPGFEPPPGGDWLDHPMLCGEQTATHEHYAALTYHDYHTGCFLPCAFRGVVEIAPRRTNLPLQTHGRVASTHALAADLALIEPELGGPNAEPNNQYADDPEDAMVAVRAQYKVLHDAATASLAHGLPILFWG